SHDQFETPVGNVFGVEIIANEISTILRDGPLRAAPLWAEMLIALAMMGAFIWTRRISSPLPRNTFSVTLIVIYILLVSLIYVNTGLIFSMSYVLLASLFAMIIVNARFYIAEMGQKALIRDAFGQYLSPRVVSDLVKNPDKLQLGGEEREMTAYFSDVASFSTFSEKMSPSELVFVLNEYLTEMCNIIIGYEGTVDKFEGDAIIAFWGAPAVQEDHARLACLASIDMKKALVPISEKWVEEGRPELRVRMGLNSGPMVVGNMGSAQRMNYTMMGDAVNLASRLEGANKAYGSDIMISETTWQACREDVDVRELDCIRVVGKSEPVTVYQLLERKNQTPAPLADLVVRFEKALAEYKQRNFQAALTGFEECLEIIADDGPSRTYVERCRMFLSTPPSKDWDGVFTLESKG
ncbi:MAG: adenylate/guanylate cyclase domain-containing protein, partial [Pseudomonadales bacterium]|nr:adenylate/guanylate cyclase domain-containing protein [Pseudomonadales bacterium]